MSDPTLEIYREAVAITEKYEQLRSRVEAAEKDRDELKAENEQLRAENLAMRKFVNCSNCLNTNNGTRQYCIYGGARQQSCIDNSHKHWKPKAVKND